MSIQPESRTGGGNYGEHNNSEDGGKIMKKMVMAGLCVFLAFLFAAYGIMLFAAIGRQAFLLSCICLSGAAWWAWCARWFVNARLLEIEQHEQMRRKVYWRQIKEAIQNEGCRG